MLLDETFRCFTYIFSGEVNYCWKEGTDCLSFFEYQISIEVS